MTGPSWLRDLARLPDAHRCSRIGDQMTIIYIRHDVTALAEVNALALRHPARPPRHPLGGSMKKHHAIGAALAVLLFAVASVALSWFAGAWWHGPVALGGGIAFVFAIFACVALLDNP